MLTAVALAGAAATACSHAFRAPEVRLVKVQPNGIGLTGGSLTAQLEVDNPNSFGLRTQSIVYSFEILDTSRGSSAGDSAWIGVTKGVIDKPLEFNGGEKTLVEIPIEFAYSDFGPAARSMLDRGTFRYRFTGTVELTEPVHRTVPFRKQDTFSLSIFR
jgi:LEA14-like dessication related protein